ICESIVNASSGEAQTCILPDLTQKYQRYIETEVVRLSVIRDNKEISEKEKDDIINSIKFSLSRAEAFKDLTLGLFEIFEKLIEESDSISHPEFNVETLRLITNFHHKALSMNDTEFLLQIWDQYVNKSIHTQYETTEEHRSHHGSTLDLFKDLLQDVGVEADRLEENMHQHRFPDGSKVHGSLDMVFKLEEEDDEEFYPKFSREGSHYHKSGKVMMLVDGENNEYILTRPDDLSAFYEDGRLIQDLIFIIIGAFLFGWIFNNLGLPAFLGYIIAGCILGPSGYNVIQELIQTETLAQFGILFIVFMLGIEFSFEKVKSIWRFALGSASMIFVVTLFFFVSVGAIINTSVNESIFIGACVSFSSTAVVERLHSVELEPLY
ncbi:568_t:CDS:2, partial [Acaulospora morrowiae]